MPMHETRETLWDLLGFISTMSTGNGWGHSMQDDYSILSLAPGVFIR
jgi:hypothetical protein